MKKRTITIISLLIAIIAISTIGLYNKKKNETKEVKTSIIKRGDLKSYLSTTGTIKSKNVKDYYGSQLKIQKVNISVGDKVKNGQSLITYDLTDLNTAVNQAQIQYDNAVLQKQELINQKDSLNLKSSGVQPVTDAKIEQAANSIELAKSSLDSANSKLNSAKNGIVSEIDGVVTSLNAVEGAVANPAQPLVTVQDLNNIKSVVSLGKYDVDKVKVGQEAVLKSSEKSYKGKVSAISLTATKITSPTGSETTLPADIDILDGGDNLKIGFDVDVDILTASKSNAIKIPVEAIKTDKYGKNYVFVVENGVAKKKEIKTGVKSDIESEATEGVKEGEKVILNPSNAIDNGTKVKETT